MLEIEMVTETDLKNYIPKIIELFRLCFTAPLKPRDFVWRYLENPYRDSNAAIALDGRKVVGFVGASPNRLIVDGQPIQAAMFLNMMTHPDYCGRGIFSRMVGKLEVELTNQGYDFLYSFPNYQSNRILIQRHGWIDIYEIPRLELAKGHGTQLNLTDSYRIQKEENYKIGENIAPMMGRKGFVHDRSYREWRIKNNPSASYDNFVIFDHTEQPAGFITIRKYKDEYNIVDFLYRSIEYAGPLLNYGVEQFDILKMNCMTAWCPTNTVLHSIYEKIGFVNKSPITYFAGKKIGAFAGKSIDVEVWPGWYLHAIDDNIY